MFWEEIRLEVERLADAELADAAIEVEAARREAEKVEAMKKAAEADRKLLKRTNEGAAEDQAEPRAKKPHFTGFTCDICPTPYTGLVANPSKYSSEEALHGHMAESHFLQWILKQQVSEENSTVCRLMLLPSNIL